MSADGRLPPYEPTEKDRTLVAALTAGGILVQKTVASFIINPATGKPIGLSTLKRHFRDELDAGMAVANARLVSTAYSQAIAGNTTMLIFLLKCRMGYKEPAQDVNLHQTYGELVKKAAEEGEAERKAKLTLVQGGRAA